MALKPSRTSLIVTAREPEDLVQERRGLAGQGTDLDSERLIGLSDPTNDALVT